MKIKGDRILLRPLEMDDLDDFLIYRTDPEICIYQNFEVFTKQEAVDFIKKQSQMRPGKPGEWCQIGIESLPHQKLIGDCAVHFKKDQPEIIELGCTIAKAYQGKGFASETMTTLIHELFKNYKAHKIIAVTDIRNTPSNNLVERLGFKKEGHFRKSYFENGNWYDEYWYGLLKEDLK